MAASRTGNGAGRAQGAAAEKPRPLFRTRQLILRDGDQVRAITLKPWLLKSVTTLMLTGLAWATFASLLFLYQARETEASDTAYRRAVAELAGQQRRITDISRGLEQQRAAVARLIQEGVATRATGPGEAEGGSHPIGALEGELAGLLGQVGNLEEALLGVRGALDGADRERQTLARERDQMALRLREVERATAERIRLTERQAAERVQEAERQVAAAQAQQEELLATLGRRTRATVAEVERILGEAGLEPHRLLPAPRQERRRGEDGNRGGPFVAASWFPSLTAESRLQEHARGVQGEVEWLARLAPLLKAAPTSAPISDFQLESRFGRRIDPLRGVAAMHTGLDLSSHYGAPVHAAGPGKVVVAGWEGAYGRVVEIDHGFGLRTRYAHLSAIAVQEGAEVGRFQRIGRLGNTGRTTGPHLHYEVIVNGRHVNPARFIQGPHKGDSHVRQ